MCFVFLISLPWLHQHPSLLFPAPPHPQRKMCTSCCLGKGMLACLFYFSTYLLWKILMGFVAGLLILIIKGLLPSCLCSTWPNSLSLSGLLECKVALNASSWGNESYLDFSKFSIMMQALSRHCFSHQELMPSSHTKAGEQMSVFHSWKVAHFWVTRHLFRRKNEGRSSHIQLFLQENLQSWSLGGSCCSLKVYLFMCSANSSLPFNAVACWFSGFPLEASRAEVWASSARPIPW